MRLSLSHCGGTQPIRLFSGPKFKVGNGLQRLENALSSHDILNIMDGATGTILSRLTKKKVAWW
jgi:hypothetical protein